MFSIKKEKEIINKQFNKQKMQMCIIRSLNMANHLASQGFKIRKVEDSEIDSRFKVFLFQDTEELHEAMATFVHKEV